MTTAVKEMMLAVSSSLAASVVVKVTVIMALGLFAAWLARGNRAAVRHALLAAAFGVTLLLPVASVLVPPVHVAVKVAVAKRASAAPPGVRGVEEVPRVPITDGPDVRAISVPQSAGISLPDLLLTLWIAGVAIFLLPLVIGLWQIRWLRRSGLPWPRGQSLADSIARDAGIHRCVRRVEVLLHEAAPSPMACGIVRPTIVLPHDAENWSEEDLTRAFVHELEHVRRGDSVSSCLARAACALYWFHPLVWIAWRRLTLEAERSCDDAVLRRSDATAYAEQLVRLAQRLYAAQRSPLVAMANRADLTTRIRALLDDRQRRGRAGAFSLGLATAFAIVLAVSMSPLILVATPQAAAPQAATPARLEQPREKPDSPRLVAQARPTAVAPPVSAAPAPAKVEFEVASVRPSPVGAGRGGPARGGPGTSDPERLTYEHTLFRQLLMDAYGVQFDQIKGPDWTTGQANEGGALFDVSAKVPPGATKEQVAIMLQNLLKDRFKLALHHETAQSSGYALVVAKGGPKLKESAGQPRESEQAPYVSGPVNLQAEKDGFPQLFPQRNLGGTFKNGAVRIRFRDYPLSDLVQQFSFALASHVIDRTGLSGTYDFTFEFTPPENGYLVGILATLPLAPGQKASVNRNGPDPGQLDSVSVVSSAMEKQLGLKLEAVKLPIDTLVIDHAEKTPTEN
jgi:uncharacterized protein (TIGR03435 family)